MLLTLSSRQPRESGYYNQAGQLVYAVTTPSTFLDARKSIIQRANMRGSLEYFGEIEYHRVRSSVIRFGGQEVKESEFLRRSGLLGRNRVFVGPDRREYKWKIGASDLKLVMDDSRNTPVAQFHPGSSGIFRKKVPAVLEIFPIGERMMDMVLLTFIYAEEVSRRSQNANGAGAVVGGVGDMSGPSSNGT